MKRWVVVVISFMALSLVTIKANAITMRYALIIGNNIGVDEKGEEPFPALLHAESEAKRLRNQLIDVSNFDEDPNRTRLLVNATVDDVTRAFFDLAHQRAADQSLIGDMESIFFLYYTGHGLSGKLLLNDGPMSGETLTRLFNRVGADFSIGVFDACYSGSLDTLLKKKGIRPTRGLNMAQNMPDQVLSSKGSVWFVSSGPGQPSYEDKNMGGVFTHFFIEALEKADGDGPGITLASIWQYAQKKTVAYTMHHNRHQTPEQFVSQMRSQAPLLFSFPERETATLVLSRQLEGRYALSYADGQLVKFIDKKAGSTKEILVYPGKVELYLFDGLVGKESAAVQLKAGDKLVVHPLPETLPETGIGKKADTLFTKGIGEGSVTATNITSAISFLYGGGYRFCRSNENLLYPAHQLLLPLRLDTARAYGIIQFSFGFRQDERSWSDTPVIPGGAISGGRRFQLGKTELQLGAGLYLGRIWQKLTASDTVAGDIAENNADLSVDNADDVTEKKGIVFQPTIEAGVIFPRNSRFLFDVSIHWGPMRAPHEGNAENGYWTWGAGGVSLTMYFKGITS